MPSTKMMLCVVAACVYVLPAYVYVPVQGGYLKLERKEMEWLGVHDLFVDESPEL